MRGVSLEEISSATRIAPRFLEALENEQWEKLPGGVFNRGFIRAIAHYLGLDEDNLVSEYALQTKGRPEPGVVPDAPDKPEPMWGRIATLVGVVLVIVAAILLAFHYLGPKIAARLHKGSADAAVSGSASVASSPATIDPAANVAAQTPAPSALNLKITALKSAEIKIVADDKPVFDDRIQSGEVKDFTAHDSIDVSYPEADSVSFVLNGQSMDAPQADSLPGHRTFTQSDLKSSVAVQH